MYHRKLYLAIALAAFLMVAAVNADGVCTGYPKMYNGKPCASTTRYWDGQKGACGCGTSDTSPFSWQWTKITAAASSPIFGSGTWCGSGCGKCFKLTPTAAGASPIGKGAPNTNSIVIKVTNLCPAAGNEQWCAYDVNSYGYDAHFDLMDYNMAGLVSGMGWDNPEVTYEEVDCNTNSFSDWNCECASAAPLGGGGSTSTSTTTTTTTTTKAPATTTTTTTQKPASSTTTTTTKAPASPSSSTTTTTTKAPSTAPTTVPTSGASSTLKIQMNFGVNSWWYGFSIDGNRIFDKVEIMDNNAAIKTWTPMSYQTIQGNEYWGMYFYLASSEMKAPLSLRFTLNGQVATATNIITNFQPGELDTGLYI
jgi:hypothetical protein